MTADELKAWRKGFNITQRAAAKKVDASYSAWQTWEGDIREPPPEVVAFILANPAPPPRPDKPPHTEAELIADAVARADRYIVAVNGLLAKYGTERGYRFAMSFWDEGAIRSCIHHYGTGKGLYRGSTPSDAAYRAMMDRLKAFYATGAVHKMAAQMRDAPAWLVAKAAEFP